MHSEIHRRPARRGVANGELERHARYRGSNRAGLDQERARQRCAEKIPSLTSQQLQGLFLTWNSGNFSGTNSIFFLAGIRYTGSMPEAKSVADYLQSRVKEAVATNFPSPAGK
jgi:hypothetical protein